MDVSVFCLAPDLVLLPARITLGNSAAKATLETRGSALELGSKSRRIAVRKQGEASRKPRLQLGAAQLRSVVPAGGKAGMGTPVKRGGGTAAPARDSAGSGQQERTCSSELVCSDGPSNV